MQKIEEFSEEIIKWYTINRRHFPWRKTENIFHILVAEVMLKRTTSTHVNKIYKEFIENFSTPEKIINAKKEDVLGYLKKLGLQNQRYKQFVKICSAIINEYEGNIPNSYDELLKINGIGDYIANAVLCFGFNKRVPIIDSNVKRIYERVFFIKEKEEIREIVKKSMPLKDYKPFNYGLLDFGALVCRPVHPKCKVCEIKKCSRYNEIF